MMSLRDWLEQEYHAWLWRAARLVVERLADLDCVRGCRERALFLLGRAVGYMEGIIEDWGLFGLGVPEWAGEWLERGQRAASPDEAAGGRRAGTP